jgi:hypothetical protein
VPARPDIVGAASHPPRRSPDQAAPNFTALLRQDSGEGLSPPLDYMAPRGALHPSSTMAAPIQGVAARRTCGLARYRPPGPLTVQREAGGATPWGSDGAGSHSSKESPDSREPSQAFAVRCVPVGSWFLELTPLVAMMV